MREFFDIQPDLDPAAVDRVAGLLREARSVLFITGAGISADSGLPTYRGIGGLYDHAGTEDGVSIEAALSGGMLARNPALTWKYIGQIERACRDARHNAAHEALAAFEAHLPRACILTQNVDGFHRDAGSKNVIEIHGDIHELFCPACRWERRVPSYMALEMPPRCPRCAQIVRPRVVLFGEILPAGAVAALGRELAEGFDVIVSIGTTSVFPYIAGPVVLASRAGIPTVEINPGKTVVSSLVTHKLAARAAPALDALRRALGW
jgi:NAD-dependent deacetylase